MSKALGTTDEITSCDCCGKSNLKSTVVIELDDGQIVHYGCVCATRNTGKSSKQINTEIRAEHDRKVAAASAEYKASPAYIAYRARLAERDQVARATGVRMVGAVAMEFVREAGNADDAARALIAAKHGLTTYQVGV